MWLLRHGRLMTNYCKEHNEPWRSPAVMLPRQSYMYCGIALNAWPCGCMLLDPSRGSYFLTRICNGGSI